MTTEKPEALSLLRKWLEERALLYCQVNFLAFAAPSLQHRRVIPQHRPPDNLNRRKPLLQERIVELLQ